MNLKKKVILITGCSSGIGKETALLLAEKRARLIITYNKNKKGGKEVFNECRKKTECLLLKLDITDTRSTFDAIKKIKRKFKKIDILINNAAVIYKKPFLKQSIKEIEHQIITNLLGTIKMTRAIFFLLNKKKAFIINIGSLKSKYPFKNVVTYCASKYGIRGFTQALSLELPKNIKICLLNPSPTSTRMTNFKGDDPKDVARIIVKVAERKIKTKNGRDVDIKNYIEK